MTKGVKSIKGNASPKVGETNYYEVASYYPGTIIKNENEIKWKLFVQERNESWRELKGPQKTGKKVPYLLPEKWLGRKMLIEAYIYSPEKKVPSAIIITPVKNNIPTIDKVELLYVDDTKGSTFSFREKLRVKAYCTNMFNKELKFTLWEDDAKAPGHNAKNKPIETLPLKKVDKNGVAVGEFVLTKALMQKAMQGEADPKQLEFYVTVEYYVNKKHATDNIEINNPFPQTPKHISQATPVLPKQPSKPAVIPKAKGSPAETKPISKKEEKGILEKVTESGKELWDWLEGRGTATKEQKPTVQKSDGKSSNIINRQATQSPISNCGEKFCIKKGDKSELIKEINIRLSGFGGNVPTDEFTDRTEKMIKQFQRDYMKVPETGKICGNVLRAIDDFGSKYFINVNEGNCPCRVCSGFGKGLFPEEKNNSKIPEKSRKYEYPGIHRSLLWVEKSIKFYLANQEKELGLRVGKINSGYRCNANNKKHGRSSTNHMGKALDIHIYKLTDQNNTEKNADKVRDLLIKYTSAEYRWKGHNVFALEPSSRNRIGDEYIATTWVHYDVRTFGLEYLKDEYFVKDNNGVNGENIMTLANKLGFKNTCLCNNNAANKLNKIEKPITTVPNKYKWSHSEFGNAIAQFESSNDYNKCNKTEKIKIIVKGKTKYKRVVKVVDSVKVIETTIKEIQKKQKDKDLFAVGRYQLIPDTLSSAVSNLKLDINRKLDQDMQDKIFDDYLIKIKRPKIIAYLEKNGNVEDAMYSSAQEWASIGVEKGKRLSDKKTKSGEVIIRYAKGGESYYAGDGLNKAHITPEQIKNKLINSKNENK